MDRLSYYRADLVTQDARTITADVCVYGGTSGGVAAAIQAARMGKTAVIVEAGDHLGGLSAGGLGYTDHGKQAAIGGIAREFYRRVGEAYGAAEEWHFEPHVAEAVFERWVEQHRVAVHRRHPLAAVERDDQRIRALVTLGGLRVRAAMFIDASYEGDLLAAAGASFTVGREGNERYGETINGVQVHNAHQFLVDVDPYVRPGDPASGLLPGIDPSPLEPPGTGDRRVQAYNFRVCMTKRPEIRVPFPKPDGYDPAEHELLARALAAGWDGVFGKFDAIRGGKTDTNNHGPVSTDFIGRNHAFPTASWEERERIFQEHVRYQQGFHWFLANEARVPLAIRERYAEWGLAKDEFTGTGNWPHQLYVREARRLVSDSVISEADCRGARRAADPVGLGSYGMDSHNCRRFVTPEGTVRNEGDVQVGVPAPYGIGYRSIVPRAGECCPNLLVPVCFAASHIAYGSARMEPVFMVLGHSAATAAVLAVDGRLAVQDVPYPALRERLLADGQVLEPPAR